MALSCWMIRITAPMEQLVHGVKLRETVNKVVVEKFRDPLVHGYVRNIKDRPLVEVHVAAENEVMPQSLVDEIRQEFKDDPEHFKKGILVGVPGVCTCEDSLQNKGFR